MFHSEPVHPHPPPSCRIRLLGSPVVEVNGSLLAPLRSRKGLWILAILAIQEDRPVERRWLAGSLWPDSPDETALGSLRRTLTDLRAALGNQAWRLKSPVPGTLILDVSEMELDIRIASIGLESSDPSQVEAAVLLSSRPFLEGCGEPWAVEFRASLSHRRSRALEKLWTLARAEGRLADAERWLRIQIGDEPLDEAAHRDLLEVLAHQGNLSGMIHHYRELRSLLHAELNVRPSEATDLLYQQLRRSQPAAPPSDGTHGVASVLPPQPAPARTASGFLPVPRTRFVGRSLELDAVTQLLSDSRQVTIIGPGGMGKTRLSQEIARRVQADDGREPWFVELEPLHNPGMIAERIATVLDVDRRGDEDWFAALERPLRRVSALLVLDGCEHLVGGVGELVSRLLTSCAELQVICTSRRPLGLLGETVYRLPPLSSNSEPVGEQQTGQPDALALFLDRARSAVPGIVFPVTETAEAINLCRRLDGLPLAIELAAARLRVFSVAEIGARLGNRFRLLGDAGPDRSPRQKSLQATLDWSCELLSAEERVLWRRLSVFSGWFDLDLATRVCGDPDGALVDELDVPRLLASLVDNSLVWMERLLTGTRYRMLESAQAYARERLEEASETTLISLRLADECFRIADEARIGQEGPDALRWLDRISAMVDDARESFQRLNSTPGAWTGRRLASAASFGHFWRVRGQFEEGLGTLKRALELAECDDAERVIALQEASALAIDAELRDEGLRLARETLRIRTELGEPLGIAAGLNQVARAEQLRENYSATRLRLEQALEIWRKESWIPGIATGLNNLGVAAMRQRDFVPAQSFHRQCLAINRQRAFPVGIAWSLCNLAVVAADQGLHAEAQAYYRQSLLEFERLGHVPGMTDTLLGLAECLLALEPRSGCRCAALLGALEVRCGADLSGEFADRRDVLLGELALRLPAESLGAQLAVGRESASDLTSWPEVAGSMR